METKIEQFGRETLGDRGQYRVLPIDELVVDTDYQRGEVSTGNTRRIAESFAWSYCGTLDVMKRRDGTCYVIDGQQRLLAARLRGDIKAMPCLVFESDNMSDEARAFLRINTGRRNVSAVYKYRAAVVANLEPEVIIEKWLKKNSFTVAGCSSRPGVIDYPATLIDTWNRNADACGRALLTYWAILDEEESMEGEIHKGFFWLEHNGVGTAKYVDKIKRLGGQLNLKREIAQAKIMAARAGIRVCGVGVLNVLNHKTKRNRLVIEEAGNGVTTSVHPKGDRD